MSPIQQPPKKYRGTIIVDANIIQHLYCEVPEGRKASSEEFSDCKAKLKNNQHDKRILHYLGVLEFLAKNGFHIVIPEIVAAEAGSVLQCGTDLMEYADIPESKRPKIYDLQLSKILGKAAKNKYNGVVVVEIREHKHPILLEPKRYTDALTSIKAYPRGSEEAQRALASIRSQFGRDLGEAAIIGYLHDTNQTGMNNIFVLTEDREAAEKIKLNCRVPVIDFHGLMRPFISNGLHRAVGLKEDITSNNIMKDCVNERSKRTEIEQFPSRNFVDIHVSNKNVITQGLFKKSITELANDLGVPNEWKRDAGQDKSHSR